jgi:hypothetical protein
MFEKGSIETFAWKWRWPIVIVVVVTALAGLQILRVNPPKIETAPEQQTAYTPAGRLVDGQISLPAEGFHSTRIDLNRRSRLTGTFRTQSLSSRVSVAVMTERDFKNWTAGAVNRTLARTGDVPGGKINLLLEAGVYFLVIDNRTTETDRSLYVHFDLDR